MSRGALIALGFVACAAERPPREAPPTEPRVVLAPPTPTDDAAPGAPEAGASAVASAAPAGGDPGAPLRGCGVRDAMPWHLRIELRAPAASHRAALVARGAELPGTLRCGRDGSMVLDVTTVEARTLFGEHASLRGVAGAGNATDACAWSASIEPASFVPPALARDVAKARFDTDPKLELVTELEPCR